MVVRSEDTPIEAEDLRMADRLSEMIVDATAALIVRMNTWHIVYATPKASRLFGYIPGALEDQPLEILIPEAARAVHAKHTELFGHNPSARPMGETGMVLTGRKRDGSSIPVAISLEPEVVLGVPLVVANVLLTHE